MSDINYPKVIKTLSALADGVDPQTGELLAKEHVFNQPDVIQSLFAAIESLNASHQRERRRRELPARAGQSWEDSESNELCELFKSGKSIKTIAEKHQRTAGAIKSQLIKLGLSEDIIR